MNETVTLTHPDGYGPIEVPPRRARILTRQGWELAGEAPVDNPGDDPDGTDPEHDTEI